MRPAAMRNRPKGRTLLRWMVALLLACAAAAAQESRGSIAGVVTDAQSAGIPGATVVITNADTGVAVTLATNERGVYLAPLLLPGTYRITAEHEGFTREGVTRSVNDSLRIDVALELGAVTETVNVVAAAPLIEASNGNMGVVVGSREVSELPLPHGNPYVLVGLA